MGRTMRKRSVVLCLLGAVALSLAAVPSPTRSQVASEGATPQASATAPAWTVSVYRVVDPYAGPALQPDLPGTRRVGAEVEIDNPSDQALVVYLNNLQLRAETGVAYPGGQLSAATDGEPRLQEGVVAPGTRVRGWVWWRLPAGETIEALVFVPAPPPAAVVPFPVGADAPDPSPLATAPAAS